MQSEKSRKEITSYLAKSLLEYLNPNRDSRIYLAREVTFDSIEKVKKFVNQVEQYPQDVDVCCGSCMVDGKSILGILSLGIRKKLNVVIHD